MNGKLIVSLDFELFWGMQDVISLDKYKKNILGGRDAIPEVLKIFEEYHIHATWAVVGLMFAHTFDDARKYFPSSNKLPTYKNMNLSTYNCFNDDKYKKVLECFFAPDIINEISKHEGQEIGCHTFSHYYANEEGQKIDQFLADISSAIEIAKDYGFNLSSIVFPRNQCNDEYLKNLKKLGFMSYRGREENWFNYLPIKILMKIIRFINVYFPLSNEIGYKPKRIESVWNLHGTRQFKPYYPPLKFLEKLKVKHIKNEMEYAAKKNFVYHLWWHPHNLGVNTNYHLNCLRDIFSYYSELHDKYNMKSHNMKELAIILENNNKK